MLKLLLVTYGVLGAVARRVRQHENLEVADGVCGPLQLPAERWLSGTMEFKVTACGSLSVGTSCEVSCPPGMIGASVRYFCFSDQASKGLPPVAARPPLCRPLGPLFIDAEKLSLSWNGNGCLNCAASSSVCQALSDITDKSDARCTKFTLNLTSPYPIRAPNGQCLDMFGGPKPGIWNCGSEHQIFKVEDGTFGSSGRMCVRSNRGMMCMHRVGGTQLDPRGVLPPRAVLQPALTSLANGQAADFLRQMQAVQQCKARLESGAPDSFWAWLGRQASGLRKSLFATFPVLPNQVMLLHEIVQSVGEETFAKMGMGPFAVAVSHTNRWKRENQIVTHPQSGFEINGYQYIKGEEEQAKQAMIGGKHAGIQSNECNNLNTCCGAADTWKFKWPRDPNPTVKEWVQWWVRKVQERGDKLWQNPLSNTPWIFGAHLWPSPIEECEWVHRKVLDNETMEGQWYLYDSSFHKRICEGGKYHPDSLPGIAVYGGVCGRMAQLEWRKSSCMGMPATQKGEPGHCAGFKFKPMTGQYGRLTVASGVVAPANSCLRCDGGACTYETAGSANCTEFNFDAKEKLIRAPNGQCVDVYAGPVLGLWGCSKGTNQLAFTQDDGTPIIRSPRATVALKPAVSGIMPAVSVRWSFEGFHGISCTKSNCHWPSVLGLDSGDEAASSGRHAEAAMATIDAWNSYETRGMWPTAYDESRLAASTAHALLKRYSQASKEDAERLLVWALRRNPALYDGWELAASLPAGAQGATPTDLQFIQTNERESLKTRKWFQSLSAVELEAGSDAQRAHAERFAKEHLLAEHMQEHWRRYPVLAERVASKLCGSLSHATLAALGQASASCRLLRQLAAGDDGAWKQLASQLLGQDLGSGNVPSGKFQEAWELFARLVVQKKQSDKAVKLVKELLTRLPVGFVSSRSQTFFAEHGRIVLGGAYAFALQLAGLLLPKADRDALLEQTTAVLQNPSRHQAKIRSSMTQKAFLKFFAWVDRHRGQHHAGSAVNEAASVRDEEDGFLADDEANDEVLQEMAADRDAEMELGAKFWDEEALDAPQGQRYDIKIILRHLLRITSKADVTSQDDILEVMQGSAQAAVPALVQLGLRSDEEIADAAEVAFSSCVKDLTSSTPSSYWA